MSYEVLTEKKARFKGGPPRYNFEYPSGLYIYTLTLGEDNTAWLRMESETPSQLLKVFKTRQNTTLEKSVKEAQSWLWDFRPGVVAFTKEEYERLKYVQNNAT